jgi:hypothetical protein
MHKVLSKGAGDMTVYGYGTLNAGLAHDQRAWPGVMQRLKACVTLGDVIGAKLFTNTKFCKIWLAAQLALAHPLHRRARFGAVAELIPAPGLPRRSSIVRTASTINELAAQAWSIRNICSRERREERYIFLLRFSLWNQ